MVRQRFIGRHPGAEQTLNPSRVLVRSRLLFPVFSLECKRPLRRFRVSIGFLWPPLIEVSGHRVPVSGTALSSAFIVMVRMVVRSERFREGSSFEGPGAGGSIPKGLFLRPADQKIDLLLQIEQLLLHRSQQGNKVHLRLIRCCRLIIVRLFFHGARLPFTNNYGIRSPESGRSA